MRSTLRTCTLVSALLLAACAPAGPTDGDAGNTPGDGGTTPGDGGSNPTDGGSTPTGTTIGAAGGFATFNGFVSVVFPEGALATDTVITIAEVSNPTLPANVTALTGVYAFGPDGATFASAATVGFPLSPPGDAKFYWTKPGSTTTWDEAPLAQIASGVVGGYVTHFSMGFVGAPGGGTTGGCNTFETLTNDLLTRYPATRTPDGPGGKLTAGPQGQLFLRAADKVHVAADGVHFEPVDAIGGGGGYGLFPDAAHDFVYRWTQSGTSIAVQRRTSSGCWTATGTIPSARGLEFLAVAPNGDVFARVDHSDNTSELFVGTGGTTWASRGPFQNYSNLTLAIAPSDPTRLYLGYSYSGSWIRKSADGGATWGSQVRVASGSVSKVFGIVVDPGDANTFYAMSDEQGLVRSTDGGATISTDPTPPGGWPAAVAFTSDRTLWVMSTLGRTAGVGLVKRANGQTTWTAVNGDLPIDEVPGIGFALVEGTPVKLWRQGVRGGVWKSADGGATWTNGTFGLPSLVPDRNATDPDDERTFYVKNQPSVGVVPWLRTTDGGATWTTLAIGDYGIPGRLLALKGGGLVAFAQVTDNGGPHFGAYSTDKGDTFQLVDGLPFESSQTMTQESEWADAATGIAYHLGGTFELYRTDDAGAHFHKVSDVGSDGNGGYTPIFLLVDPTTSKHLFNYRAAQGAPGTFWESTDGGETWNTAPLPAELTLNVTTMAIDLTGRLWMEGLGPNSAQTVWTLDHGASAWVMRNHPNPASNTIQVFGDTVKVDEYVSTDGGATWSQPSFTAPLPWQFDELLVVHRANPKRVLFQLPALRNGLMP